MTYPVTVYQWDDPGAPQLVNRSPSELIDIFKKCLVTGYGTKLPLGWSMPFEDAVNYKAVFRNDIANGGSGGYFLVKSSDGSDSANRFIQLTPAKSMVDVDTAIQPGFTKSFGLTTALTEWTLIGTAIGFYLCVGANGRVAAAYNSSISGRETSMYVGDFESVIPNDAGRFVVVAKPTASGDVLETANVSNQHTLTEASDTLLASSSTAQSCRIYDADNFDSFRSYAFGYLVPGASRGSSATVVGSDITKKRELFMKAMLVATSWSFQSQQSKDRLDVFLTQSDVSPALRGFLPGLIYELVARYTTETLPVVEQLNGHDHYLLCMNFGRMAGHWINMVEW